VGVQRNGGQRGARAVLSAQCGSGGAVRIFSGAERRTEGMMMMMMMNDGAVVESERERERERGRRAVTLQPEGSENTQGEGRRTFAGSALGPSMRRRGGIYGRV
jgi:hypothetical protein